MRGILWNWLLGLGFIFWIALCCTDYYRKNTQKEIEILYEEIRANDLRDQNIFLKKEPPALTVWKTLFMIISVSALVYIKRTSNLRKYSNINLKRLLEKPVEETDITCKTRVYNNITVFPARIEYKKFKLEPEINSEQKSTEKKPVSSAFGVELVQRKLEDLEKSVATLKQKYHTSAGSGIVSGTPEFRKFLYNCRDVQNLESISEVSVDSSQLSVSSDKVPGNGLVATASSSNNIREMEKKNLVLSEHNSTDSLNTCSDIELKQSASENSSVKTKDSSWSTLSEDNSDISDIKMVTQKDLSNTTVITEILQAKQSFSKSSKSSIDDSIESLLVEKVSSEETVPGSNPVASSSSLFTTSTLKSSTSNYLASFFGEVSSSEENDSLNSLD